MLATEHPTETNGRKVQRWAILGGGAMGIALAERLIGLGQQVTILEAGPTLGGLASGWKIGEVEWDKFYHVILLSDSKLRATLDRIGLDEEIQWVTTKTGFFSGGQLYSMSNSWEFLNFPPLSLIEKFRLGGTIFYASKIKDWQPLESIPVTQWLKKLSGSGTFNKIWLPLLKAKLGSAYDRTSAAFIWAYISRMYKARRSGLKTEMFGYVPGGYGRIMRCLQQRLVDLGVELCFQSPVQSVRRASASNLSSSELEVTLASGETRTFDRVIATLPSAVIGNICPDLQHEEQRQLRSVEYLGVVCMSLLLKRGFSPYYVTNITDDWVPMTGIIEMSTVVDPKQLGNQSLIYLPKYLPEGDPGLDEPDDTLKERFLGAIERMFPSFSRADVVACQIARAKKVMAIPTLNYSQKLPPIKTSVPGFYALNSAHITSGTLNVNESIELAETKFDEVIWPDFMDSNALVGSRPAPVR